MEDNKKPNVFPPNNTKEAPMSEGEKEMLRNREIDLANRNIANPMENNIKPLKIDIKTKTPLVEPDFGSDFDVLPLPSRGKTYKNKSETIKVSFLNASDENTLTNPNLLKSGKFLDVLFGRKILDPSLKYEDLLVGDRNAIMVWLRATGFGNMYPIQVMDPETYEEFSVEIDLDELNTIKLELDPDENGYFDFELPLAKKNIKFRFLTVGDTIDIEDHAEKLKKASENEFDLPTFTLLKQVVAVDGNDDKEFVKSFVKRMRMLDTRSLKKYMNENVCGIDLSLTVLAPGGGQVKTYFPLNTGFFWPQF